MIRFHCPSCNKLYAFKVLPVPDEGAEFLCARCDARCHLTVKNEKATAELIAVPEEGSGDTQQTFDTYRPDKDEWYTSEELELHLRGLVKELPIGCEFLIGITEGPDRGITFPVKNPDILIGKTGCDINLSDTSVSRMHCRIEFFGHEMIVVRDCDSAWGTFRNSDPVTLAVVRPGDTLQIGKTALTIIQMK